MTSLICPICRRGSLLVETYSERIQHAGKTLTVNDLEGCRCDTCGADPVLTEQIKRNQVRICDAKRRGDGLLTSGEIRAIRERLRLSQPDAATLFGGGSNAFSKYERGEVMQSVPMDRLLRAAAAFPLLADYFRVLAGLDVAMPQESGYAVAQSVSLNDPAYTSKPLIGEHVRVSSTEKESRSVISFTDWRNKKVA